MCPSEGSTCATLTNPPKMPRLLQDPLAHIRESNQEPQSNLIFELMEVSERTTDRQTIGLDNILKSQRTRTKTSR